MTEEEAAEIIQKAYRKSALKKIQELSLQDYELLSEEQYDFVKPFAKKWKNKSIFNVLLQYRARRIQDSFNFAQQVSKTRKSEKGRNKNMCRSICTI